MTVKYPIQILCGRDGPNGVWKSNYEKENFWPANKGNLCWKTYHFLDSIRLLFDKNSNEYCLTIDEYKNQQSGYYLIFYGTSVPMTEHHGLGFLTQEIVEKCNQGMLKLLIVFVHETFDANGTSCGEWFRNFCMKLNQIGLTKSHSVVVLTGTKLATDLNCDHRCQLVYYPWFEAALQIQFKQKKKLPVVIDFSKKHKHYINLNFSTRPHRFLMVLYLMYRNVSQYGNISWKNPHGKNWKELLTSYGYDDRDFSWIRQLDGYNYYGVSLLNFINAIGTLNSINLDLVDGEHTTFSWISAENFYENSWIELVNETHYELYGNVFLTEKTFKPMAYGLPFILNSSRNSLAVVKELGYKTFPELFDETYDSMPGNMNKIANIGEQIATFCTDPHRLELLKTSADLSEKLHYNQNLFWNKNHSQLLGELLYNAWIKGRA